jgi:hypothetical protein
LGAETMNILAYHLHRLTILLVLRKFFG